MKVVSVVGTKKTGKTTLVCALVSELARYGRVGTVKNMATHPVDRGDTRRHFDAGADVVVGLGQAHLMVRRERGDLNSALAEMEDMGMDYVVVEGFKHSDMAKIVMGDLDAANALRRIDLADLNCELVRELADMVRRMQDYESPK